MSPSSASAAGEIMTDAREVSPSPSDLEVLVEVGGGEVLMAREARGLTSAWMAVFVLRVVAAAASSPSAVVIAVVVSVVSVVSVFASPIAAVFAPVVDGLMSMGAVLPVDEAMAST